MNMIKKSKIIVATKNNDLKVELHFKDKASDKQIAKWLRHFSELIDCRKCKTRTLKWASRNKMCWKCFSKKNDEKTKYFRVVSPKGERFLRRVTKNG